MSNDEGQLAIRVTAAPNQLAAIKSIRAATGLSLTEIKTAFRNRAPITVARLYGIDHDEKEQVARSLLDELKKAGVDFEIILDGRVESHQYFINAMERWRDFGVHGGMMAELESGEPSIETLEWLRSQVAADFFQQTLQQIVNRDGYNVDAETFSWAQRQLNDA